MSAEIDVQTPVGQLTGAESSGSLSMTVTDGPKGPRRSHPRSPAHQRGDLLPGWRLRVSIDGEHCLLTRGDFVSIPAGAEHSYAMEARLSRFVSVYGRAGVERLHEITGQISEHRILPEQAEPIDRDRLSAAAAQLDIVFVG